MLTENFKAQGYRVGKELIHPFSSGNFLAQHPFRIFAENLSHNAVIDSL